VQSCAVRSQARSAAQPLRYAPRPSGSHNRRYVLRPGRLRRCAECSSHTAQRKLARSCASTPAHRLSQALARKGTNNHVPPPPRACASAPAPPPPRGSPIRLARARYEHDEQLKQKLCAACAAQPCGGKCASRKKIQLAGGIAFVTRSQPLEASRENTSRYDGSASGALHLNTTRLIQDQAGNTVWRWDQGEPFGNDVPNNNPSGQGAFDFPLRFPGQYFDKETALHYNMFRDYDPSIGRYVESDPIGLDGGLNVYAYVRSNPLFAVDPYGLAAGNPTANPCELAKQFPPTPDDPCNCQRDVLVDLCKCYRDDPLGIVTGRGVCVQRAYLKKTRCAADCAPKDACLGSGPIS